MNDLETVAWRVGGMYFSHRPSIPRGIVNEAIALVTRSSAESVLRAAHEERDAAIAECGRLRMALERMVEMIDFHHRDGYLPDNETDVPLEMARAALAARTAQQGEQHD